MMLMEAMQSRQMAVMTGIPDMASEALLRDFMMGKHQKELDQRIADTTRIAVQRQIDLAVPNFKRQMKKLVTRVITCGVGYVRLALVRNDETPPSEDRVGNMPADRMKEAMRLADELQDEDIETSPMAEQLRSIGVSLGVPIDDEELPEKITFDFLPSTSVIPDERCRSLSDFIGARFVCIEYSLPLDEINAMFGTDIEAGGKLVAKPQEGQARATVQNASPSHAVREILNFKDRTHFYILEGYEDYLRPPEPVVPGLSGFWPLMALTFNDVEVGIDDDEETSPFPPSDVDLVFHPQKEWNRSRHALRSVRNACSPKWMTRKGSMSPDDIRKIQDAEPNEVIQLESVSPDMKLSDLLAPVPVQVPSVEVFGTDPLVEDITLGGGMQEANIGAAPENVTATGTTVAEQSRMQVSASNKDDLDEFLSSVMGGCGEMMLSDSGFSEQTIVALVGNGAVWPTKNRVQYKKQITVAIKAGSTGRPNKALEVSNYNLIAPQLINAGANPLGVIQEGVKRLDDQLDVTNFMPMGGLGGPLMGAAGGVAAPGAQQQLPNGAPVAAA